MLDSLNGGMKSIHKRVSALEKESQSDERTQPPTPRTQCHQRERYSFEAKRILWADRDINETMDYSVQSDWGDEDETQTPEK